MEPVYPIFILARDENSLVGLAASGSEVRSGYYEAIDVEDALYGGWDSLGYPIELYLEGKQIRVRRAGEQPRLDQLRSAILAYARFGRPTEPFVYSGSPADFVGLFNAAEAHIRAGHLPFRQKLKRWFHRK